MCPQITVRFLSKLQLEQLIALVHRALATSSPLFKDGDALAAMYNMGWQEYDINHCENALESFQIALIAAQQQGKDTYIVGALQAIAWILDHGKSRPPAIEPCFREASVTAEQELLANLLGRATVRHGINDWRRALSLYQQALEIAKQQQALKEIGLCLNGLGLIYLSRHQFERGQTYSQAAIAIAEDIGNRPILATAAHNLGVALYWQQQYNRALSAFGQAQRVRHQLGDNVGEALTLDYMGRIYACQQAYMFALSCYQAALECYSAADQSTLQRQIAALKEQMALLCEQTHHYDLAIAYYLEALDIFQACGEHRSAILMQHCLARLHEVAGQTAIALHYYQLTWGNAQPLDTEWTEIAHHPGVKGRLKA